MSNLELHLLFLAPRTGRGRPNHLFQGRNLLQVERNLGWVFGLEITLEIEGVSPKGGSGRLCLGEYRLNQRRLLYRS